MSAEDKSKRKKRPSMKDVAARAGVSRTTVSFVLNGREMNIPEATQRRVWDAVEALGYRPNTLARSLRAQRSHTIGFISDEIGTTPYAGEILQGAQDLAWEHETLLLSVNTSSREALKRTAVNMLLDRQVDGIIYAAMYHRAVHPPKNITDVPVVLLDCYVDDRSLPSVVPDEVKGGYEATHHLLEKGHRRIGFLCDGSGVPAAVGRLDGYQQALAAYGVAFDPALVTYSDTSVQAGGFRDAHTLMQLDEPPTALFCFNDRMAMGAYDALRERGYTVPDDVAVVGFDNQELIAAHLHPSLTTMQLPHYAMGQWAVQHLLQLIDGATPTGPPIQHMLDCPLVERAST